MRALASSGFSRAFRKAASAATFAGIVFVMSSPTRSRSSQAMSPKRSLNVLRMFESRSISVFRHVSAAAGQHRLDLGVFVRQQDLLDGALLDAVDVHVDGVEDAR